MAKAFPARVPGRILAIATVFALAPGSGATIPLSPHLERSSLDRLNRELAGAGISETEGSAVAAALYRVLGAKPQKARYRYRQAAPQLPDVDAVAQPLRKGCAKARLTITPKAKTRLPTTMNGVYCLADPKIYAWRIDTLTFKP